MKSAFHGHEVLDDNARKFVVSSIDSALLDLEVSRYELITDWLEMASDNEKKLAYKKYPTGELSTLFNAEAFPGSLLEVTGDRRYYGYRVGDMVRG